MSETTAGSRLDRRDAIKWMMSAVATLAVIDPRAFGTGADPTAPHAGYGTDPDLLKSYKPGDYWPLTMTEAERRTAGALCDVVIPADVHGPNASAVGVPAFIDEWISAPYPGHGKDQDVIREGLAWLEAESQRRFGADFASLIAGQKSRICDDICFAAKATPEFKKPAAFFKLFRDLTAGGYYTTPEGMKDIGYVGNVPLAQFDGPPPEALAKLGLG